VTVVVDDDRERGFALSRGGIATFARFSAMHGHVYGSVSDHDQQVMLEVPRQYDMYRHARSGPQGDVITRDFADRFAIIGPESYCTERLLELVDLGIDRFHVGGASRGEDPEQAEACHRRFVDGVMGRLAR
jgi:5,10-methylenetetrahydromethanopterin reductase